jgi:hypothetical protein
VGQSDFGDGWIGPLMAWRVACAIHPWTDLGKWWLGTGWCGPKSPDWYAGFPLWQLENYFLIQNRKEISHD